ncbi:hypothetical protein BJ322DRAFT_1022463 [Thelephora terrestris]|uniref:Uncharacterized protein n=1 Tax=Thelephora terrestris TaxID=56493 RepID=A0A9P6HAU4_9AGAM|nr:hypothetical protein BJ322DRAFT_1022463 [Thelephora terrestris]
MTSPETADSPQIELLKSFIEGFKTIDIDRIAKTLHKDHRRITYPKSLGVSEQTKEETPIEPPPTIKSTPQATIHSIIEAPGKVVVHLTSKVNTAIGVQFNREMILIAHAAPDDDGSLKLKQVEEFTDSQAYLDFFKAVTAAKAREGA